jgi:hypothetical protein
MRSEAVCFHLDGKHAKPEKCRSAFAMDFTRTCTASIRTYVRI